VLVQESKIAKSMALSILILNVSFVALLLSGFALVQLIFVIDVTMILTAIGFIHVKGKDNVI